MQRIVGPYSGPIDFSIFAMDRRCTVMSAQAVIFRNALARSVLAAAIVAISVLARGQERPDRPSEESPVVAEPETTTRPQTPPNPPDPNELDLKPDDDGKLQFNFQGQPWLSVVEWLAEVSHLSLDWQELPAGY